jgi:enoyl-CoA hydratase/carnithine racemase
MPNVLRQDDQGVAVLTLNRPQVLNALDTPMFSELHDHIERIASDDSRAFVLTGTGRAFCVGSDLKESVSDPDARIRHMHALVQRLHDFPKIGVAAISGYALGGGLELALGCAFRIAHPDARLGLPEIKLGLIPAYGATQLLPRAVGERRALDLMLSGNPIDAATALRWGMIDHVEEDVVRAAVDFARARAGNKPVAEAAIRAAVLASRLPLEEGLAVERRLALETSNSLDAKAGVAAFVAR